MLKKRYLLAALISVLFFGLAHAQSTLGEALDKGAVKITGAEWRAMLPKRIMGLGPLREDGYDVFFYPDGKLLGYMVLDLKWNAPLSGTWRIDESGKICVDQVYKFGGMIHGGYEGCAFMFKIGENIFHVNAGSEADRSAKTIKRTIKK